MNHHYQDNYHGYVRGAAGMQNMGYGHGVYEEQMPMGQMGPARSNYQMPQYRDSGQMHPMMQHQQQNNMYPAGVYMNQMSGSSYGMGGYSGYGMQNQATMNASSPMMMGPRGNVMGAYYNHHMDSQARPRNPTPVATSSYNQVASGGPLHGQSQMNHLSNSQNCSPSQTGAIRGGQSSHCASPHGMAATPSNNGFQGQGTAVNHTMMTGVAGQQRPPSGNMSGSSMHTIPQHPMRHPTTQQNPQEVADNILQIASSYPTNQTVQVPLKSRHAPYHIPRSPHYSVSSSDHGHSSPMASHSQQTSPAPQPSPTPSTSSVKSPTPSLAPIPNPIPSPGVTGLRSPCNQGGMACGSQRSPAHMASNYSGHTQPSPSPHHYSPTSMGNQQHFPAFAQSPTMPRTTHASYPSTPDSSIFPSSAGHDVHPSYSSQIPSSAASPHQHNMMPSDISSHIQLNQGKGNNPLMSLQKLVMLPETQVVDPKSVVNDACLTSQPNENEEIPKNGEDPAGGSAESAGSSVGCSGQSSSHTLPSDGQTLAKQTQVVFEPGDLKNDSSLSTEANESSTSDVHATKDIVNNVVQSGVERCVESVGFEEEDKGVSEASCKGEKHNMVSSPPTVFGRDQEDVDSKGDVHLSLNSNKIGVSDSMVSTDEQPKQLEAPKEVTEKNPLESPDLKDVTLESKAQNEIYLPKTDEASSEHQNEGIVHSLKRKNGKINGLHEDVKISLPCRSPGVLSEVPLLVNGLATNDVISDSVDNDTDEEGEKKLQRNFSSRLRSKLRIGEKTGQFVRLTTPCSIAVGADERAMCERFTFRRNDYCHALRTSRLLCNGRIRQDSTGYGDSDESIENVSDGSFHALGNPQDGCKKKATSTSAKRTNGRNSTVNNGSHLTKKDSLTSGKGHIHGARNGHVSNERTSEASDEDGDICYYEGVDSSDFFLSTVSSDDSISSSQEGKQATPSNSSLANASLQNLASESKKQYLSPDERQNIDEHISSPPSKRTRSSEQKQQEPVNKMSPSTNIPNSSNLKLDVIIDTSDSATIQNLQDINSEKINQTVDPQENGKITRSRKRRPPSASVIEKLSPNDHKLPEAVVRLEKSPIAEKNPVKLEMGNSSLSVKIEKSDPIIVDSSPEIDEGKSIVSQENSYANNNNAFKSEPAGSNLSSSSVSIPSTSKTDTKGIASPRKKKPSKKGKKKISSHDNRGRTDEIKDSFRSMKFSRTLDMMKSQKKKDSCQTGPFIRIEGSRNAPNTVSVFNQPSQDFLQMSSKQKNNQKQSHSRNIASATVHLVTNLSNDKTIMVSSSKYIQNQQWSCAFCSHHSSFRSLGDLFGPYFKEADLPLVESISLEESKKGDSLKDSPKSSNISAPRQAKGLSSDKKVSRKRKLSGKPEQQLPQEIWLHESCALWAPGVYLIGNKIYGLDDAIRDAAETICSVCKGRGAMIGCLYKGCAMKYHFACATEKDCCFDEGNFSLLCPKHKDKKFNLTSSSSAQKTS